MIKTNPRNRIDWTIDDIFEGVENDPRTMFLVPTKRQMPSRSVKNDPAATKRVPQWNTNRPKRRQKVILVAGRCQELVF